MLDGGFAPVSGGRTDAQQRRQQKSLANLSDLISGGSHLGISAIQDYGQGEQRAGSLRRAQFATTAIRPSSLARTRQQPCSRCWKEFPRFSRCLLLAFGKLASSRAAG